MEQNFEIPIHGMSMYPTFRDQDLLICSHDISDLDIGDIIVFKDQTTSEYTCHRIISLSPLQTKGDNSICKDQIQELHPIAKVIGANGKVWNKSGQPYKYLHSFLSRNFMTEGLLRKPAKLVLMFFS